VKAVCREWEILRVDEFEGKMGVARFFKGKENLRFLKGKGNLRFVIFLEDKRI
jgi:hypothetical protein